MTRLDGWIGGWVSWAPPFTSQSPSKVSTNHLQSYNAFVLHISDRSCIFLFGENFWSPSSRLLCLVFSPKLIPWPKPFEPTFSPTIFGKYYLGLIFWGTRTPNFFNEQNKYLLHFLVIRSPTCPLCRLSCHLTRSLGLSSPERIKSPKCMHCIICTYWCILGLRLKAYCWWFWCLLQFQLIFYQIYIISAGHAILLATSLIKLRQELFIFRHLL